MPVVSSISPELNSLALKTCNDLRKTKTIKFQLLGDTVRTELMDRTNLSCFAPGQKHDFSVAIQCNPSFFAYGKKQQAFGIDPADCIQAIKCGLNKIIFGNEKGFTSMDFSTSTNDPEKAIPFLQMRLESLANHTKLFILPRVEEMRLKMSDVPAELQKYLKFNNEAFAKRFDWTYEEGKWENFKP